VVLLSAKAVRSEWVKRELLYALRDLRYRDRIVPVVHRVCNVDRLSWTLASFQQVDFTNGFDVGCESLLRTWGIGFQPQA
jgi:hypothetical protein